MSANPVDDTRFTKPLVRALQHQVDACAAALPDAPPARRHTIAAAWVYTTVLVAWAEDHGLIDPWLRASAAEQRATISRLPGGAQLWLIHAAASLAVHPSTRCLVDRRWNPRDTKAACVIGGVTEVACDDQAHAEWLAAQMVDEHGLPRTAVRVKRAAA